MTPPSPPRDAKPGAPASSGGPSRRWPLVSLVAILLLHLGLSIHQAWDQSGIPLPLHHQTYTRVNNQIHYLTGEDRWLQHTTVDEAHAPFPRRPLDRHSEAGWLHDLRDGRLQRILSDGYANLMAYTYLWPGLVALFFPGHPLWVRLAPLLFLLVLLISVYGIGRWCHSPSGGLTAVAVASGYPAVFGFARTHNDSVPLASGAFLGIWMLLESEGLTRARYALAAGLALAVITNMGENASGSAIAYVVMLGPLSVQLGLGIRHTASNPRQAWRLLLGLALLIAPPLLALEWGRWDAIVAYFTTGSQGNLDWPAGIPSEAWAQEWAHATAYLWQLAGDLVRPPLLLWGVVGLILLLHPSSRHKGRLTILLSFLVPLIVVTLIPRKSSWYLSPALPGLALITAVGLHSLRKRWLRITASALAVLTGLACLTALSLAGDDLRIGILGEGLLSTRSARMAKDYNLPPAQFDGVAHKRLGLTAREIGERLDAALPPNGRRRWVALVQPRGHAGWEQAYYLELLRPDLRVMPLLRLHDSYDYIGDAAFEASLYDLVICVDADNELTSCEGYLWPSRSLHLEYSLSGCPQHDRIRKLIPQLRDHPTLEPEVEAP
jgi:hypothetical protein